MKRTFRITMSERCFRYKPEALHNHAPHQAGVYEFVTFDAQRQAQVLYVGLAGSIFDALSAHMTGKAAPVWDDLFKVAPDIYFDYVAAADVDSEEEWKDIAAALIAKHKPRFNSGPAPSSGRHAEVELVET